MASPKIGVVPQAGFDWKSTGYRYFALAMAMAVAGYVSGGAFQAAAFALVSAVPVFLYALFDPSTDRNRGPISLSNPSAPYKPGLARPASAFFVTAISGGVLAGAAAKWTTAFGPPAPFTHTMSVQVLYAFLVAVAMASFSAKRTTLGFSLVFVMGAVPCVMSEMPGASAPVLAGILWVSAFVPIWVAHRILKSA